MCFELKKETKKLVAEKDIKCYKTGRTLMDPVDKKKIVFESEYFFYCYRKDQFNEERELIIEDYNSFQATRMGIPRYAISEGYHSYKSIHAVYDRVPIPGVSQIINEMLTLAEFVIPKGSTYYENQYEYVSSNIVLKKTISANAFKKMIRTFKYPNL